MIRKTGRVAQFRSRRKNINQDHLKRHVHLTNCIHLKNHLHKQKAEMKLDLGNKSEVSLVKELSALRKSRSLRDPSTSPSWKSPNVGSLMRKLDKGALKDGLRHERPMQASDSRLLRNASKGTDVSNVDKAIASSTGIINEDAVLSDKDGWVKFDPGFGTGFSHDIKGNEGSTSQAEAAIIGLSEKLHPSKRYEDEQRGRSSETESKTFDQGRNSKTGKKEASSKDARQEAASSSDPVGRSKARTKNLRKGRGKKGRRLYRQSPTMGMNEKEDRYTVSGLMCHDLKDQRPLEMQDNLGASTSGENDELDISELPHHACGMPWNWSRIHRRGKNVLDMAGRSLSGASSDSLARKVAKAWSRGHRSTSGDSMPATTSEYSDFSVDMDSENLPLLEPGPLSDTSSPSGLHDDDRQDQTDSSDIPYGRRGWWFRETQTTLGSEYNHHSLSQKYMPKSFHGIVGQNLITQALSNALSKGRIAPMYIFYGPRGTGKTSCARVFAVALNCLSGEAQKPCGSCAECLAHQFGKTAVVKEFNAGGNNGVKGIKTLMHDVTRSSSSHYRVYIVDECHQLSSQAWNAFLKVVEEAPRNIVFILSTSSLEQLPHEVVSRCQKFFFSKIKECDILNRLQFIARQEGLEADVEALKLIASACDGSLRDAEMMLDQLSLLGQKVSLPMVQELMGLVPDEDLIELLDFALSADTVNTARNVKELMVSGVEPLNLMSQLACLITSILAGGYQIPKETHRRKFFKKKQLTKEDMERLRQALKILSEAEKQLRSSLDRTTWLTAALLQLAPDQSYLLPSSFADTSVTQSPVGINDINETPEVNLTSHRLSDRQTRHTMLSKSGPFAAIPDACNAMPDPGKFLAINPKKASHSTQVTLKDPRERGSKLKSGSSHSRTTSTQLNEKLRKMQATLTNHNDLEEVWQRVLDGVHSNSLRKFLQTHGKLLSLSLSKGFAVALVQFEQFEHASRAERSRTSIAHAFYVTLGYPVEIKVQLAMEGVEQQKGQVFPTDQPSTSNSVQQPLGIPGNSTRHPDYLIGGADSQIEKEDTKPKSGQQRSYQVLNVQRTASMKPTHHHRRSENNHSSEIVALESSRTGRLSTAVRDPSSEEKLETAWAQVAPNGDSISSPTQGKNNENIDFRSNSQVKNTVSIGFVIQQAEGSVEGYSQDLQFDHMRGEFARNCSRHGGPDFATQEGHSDALAARLEEENLRLESRSGGLLCWNTSDAGHERVKNIQQSPRRSGFLLSLCPCTKSNKS